MPGFATTFVSGPYGLLLFGAGLMRLNGDPYHHHGQQQHFMLVRFTDDEWSSVLWDPDCESIEYAACTEMLEKKANGDMPARDGLLTQLINYTDHMMLASYIPYAWSTLRRWQQAQEIGATVISRREYRVVDDAIHALEKRLADYYREVRYEELPRGLPANQEAAMSALFHEQSRLHRTRQRLQALHYRNLTLADVYGSAALSPEFASGLERWAKHAENQSVIRMARIPRQLDDGVMLASQRQYFDSTS